MSGVSPATARLAWDALDVRARRAQLRRNGRELPLAWVRAFRELEEVVGLADDPAGFADATAVRPVQASVPRSELIDVAQAARRLGISPQAVRKRLAVGSLPGRLIGRSWVVEWRADGREAAAG